jgi:hypothetical protein
MLVAAGSALLVAGVATTSQAANPGEPHYSPAAPTSQRTDGMSKLLADVSDPSACKPCQAHEGGALPAADCPHDAAACATLGAAIETRSERAQQLEVLATRAALLDASAFGLLRVLRDPAPSPSQPAAQIPSRGADDDEGCVRLN